MDRRVALAAFLISLSAAACGGASTPPPEVPVANIPPPTATAAPEPGEEEPRRGPKPRPADEPKLGFDKEHPVPRCGPRDSYEFVASYACKDGSTPLGGNPANGSKARRGNVGANATGHIIDLYVVPCVGGEQQIYVDMYGCPEFEKMLLNP